MIIQPKKQFMFYCCQLKAYVKKFLPLQTKKRDVGFFLLNFLSFFFPVILAILLIEVHSYWVSFYILLEQTKGPPFHVISKQVRKENPLIAGGGFV